MSWQLFNLIGGTLLSIILLIIRHRNKIVIIKLKRAFNNHRKDVNKQDIINDKLFASLHNDLKDIKGELISNYEERMAMLKDPDAIKEIQDKITKLGD